MPSPTMTKPSPGNLIIAQTLAASKNVATRVDATALIEAQVTARATTGSAVAATAGVRFEAWPVVGTTTLSGAAAAAATSVNVNSANGLSVGMKVAVNNELRTIGSGLVSTTINNSGGYAAGSTSIVVASATGLSASGKITIGSGSTAETRTISAISSNTLTIDALVNAQPNGAAVVSCNVPVDALQNAQASGASVYVLAQNPVPQSMLLGASAANTPYGDKMYLGTDDYVIVLTNTDASNSVAVEASQGSVTGYA